MSWCVFTQSNAQVQRWRGKGLLMFPGLFIQPSVWLRTNSHLPHISPPTNPHPASVQALLQGFPPQMTSQSLQYDWWRVQCGLCEKRSWNFYPHVFWAKLSTHSSILYKGNKSANSQPQQSHSFLLRDEGGGGALLSISNSSCNFLYKHRSQGLMICCFILRREVKSELCVWTCAYGWHMHKKTKSVWLSFWADVHNANNVRTYIQTIKTALGWQT